MAKIPISKRRSRSRAAEASAATAARLSVLQAALAMATTKLQRLKTQPSRGEQLRRKVPFVKKRSTAPPKGRVAIIAAGGAVVAGLVSTLLRKRSGKGDTGTTSEPATPVQEGGVRPNSPAPTPALDNADLTGPPTNTSTPMPAPVEAREPQVIDEAAEEAAAAAEAAAIGGGPVTAPLASDDPSDGGVDPAEQPVLDAGGGESEGQEQSEAALRDAIDVEHGLQASNEGDTDPRAQQIDDVIEAQDEPASGEQAEYRA